MNELINIQIERPSAPVFIYREEPNKYKVHSPYRPLEVQRADYIAWCSYADGTIRRVAFNERMLEEHGDVLNLLDLDWQIQVGVTTYLLISALNAQLQGGYLDETVEAFNLNYWIFDKSEYTSHFRDIVGYLQQYYKDATAAPEAGNGVGFKYVKWDEGEGDACYEIVGITSPRDHAQVKYIED